MSTLIKLLTFAILTMSVQCNMGNYNTINGEGEVSEKEISISSFSELSAANGWDVKLVQDSQDRILVKANENLLKEIKIDEDGETLKISTKSRDNIGKADAKLVTVYFSGDVARIKASSGVNMFANEQLTFGDLTLDSSSGSEVELNVKTGNLDCSSSSGSVMELKISSKAVVAKSSSGSRLDAAGKSDSFMGSSSSGSSMNLEGNTDNLDVSSSSGSNVNAENLMALSVKANSSSGSRIDVYPMENLDANSSSGSSINYHNKPSKNITKNASSGGSINSK